MPKQMQSLTKNRIVYRLLNSLKESDYSDTAHIPGGNNPTCHLSLRVLSSDKAAATGATSSGTAVDIGVVRYNAKDILPANIQAKPEEGEVTQKLIPTLSDAEIEEVRCYGAIFSEGNKSLPLKRVFIHLVKLQSKLYFFF